MPTMTVDPLIRWQTKRAFVWHPRTLHVDRTLSEDACLHFQLSRATDSVTVSLSKLPKWLNAYAWYGHWSWVHTTHCWKHALILFLVMFWTSPAWFYRFPRTISCWHGGQRIHLHTHTVKNVVLVAIVLVCWQMWSISIILMRTLKLKKLS